MRQQSEAHDSKFHFFVSRDFTFLGSFVVSKSDIFGSDIDLVKILKIDYYKTKIVLSLTTHYVFLEYKSIKSRKGYHLLQPKFFKIFIS